MHVFERTLFTVIKKKIKDNRKFIVYRKATV